MSIGGSFNNTVPKFFHGTVSVDVVPKRLSELTDLTLQHGLTIVHRDAEFPNTVFVGQSEFITAFVGDSDGFPLAYTDRLFLAVRRVADIYVVGGTTQVWDNDANDYVSVPSTSTLYWFGW